MKDFFDKLGEKKEEYEKAYKIELTRRIKERQEEKKTEGLDRLIRDMNITGTKQRGIVIAEMLLM